MSILDIFSIFHREKFAEADRNLELLGLRQSVAALKQAEAADKAQIEMLQSEISALNKQAADLRRADRDASNSLAKVQHDRDAVWRMKEEAERARKLALIQVQAFREAVSYLAERAKVSPEEMAQLGLGTVIPGDRKKGEGDTFVFGDLEDMKDAIDFAMHNQATVAKFRQLKEHFVKHQQAVTILLDQISAVTRKNTITAEDHNRLRNMREALSSLIRRTI